MATGVGKKEIKITPSDSLGPKIWGVSVNSAQLSFTGTELYRFEVLVDRNAIFLMGVK